MEGHYKAIQNAKTNALVYCHQSEDLPDSLFPNNWFSTHRYLRLIDNHIICVNSMKAPTRQREVNPQFLECLTKESRKSLDLTKLKKKEE